MQRGSFVTRLCCCFAAILFFAIRSSAAAADDLQLDGDVRVVEKDELTRISQGYRANIEAFRQIRCEYELRVGVAASEADAVAGRIAPNDAALSAAGGNAVGGELCAKYLWIQDGAKRRLEENVENDEQLAEQLRTSERRPLRACGARALTDGEVGIHFNLMLSSGALFDRNDPPPREVLYPFDYASPSTRLNLSKLIESTIDNVDLYVSGSKGDGTLKAETIRLDWMRKDASKNPPHSARTSWVIDPQQGFLPREIIHTDTHDGTVVDKCVVTAVEHVPGVGWLPMRSVYLSHPAQQHGRRSIAVRELTVARYQIGPRPASDFTIEMPPDGLLHYNRDANAGFRFYKPQNVDFEKIREYLSFALAKAQGGPRTYENDDRPQASTQSEIDFATSPTPPQSPLFWAWIGINVLVAIGVGVIFWRYKKARG